MSNNITLASERLKKEKKQTKKHDLQILGSYPSHQYKGHIHCRHRSTPPTPPTQSVTLSQLNHWHQWHKGRPALQKSLRLQKGTSESSHSQTSFQWDEGRCRRHEWIDWEQMWSEASCIVIIPVSTLRPPPLCPAHPQWARLITEEEPWKSDT